MVGLFFHKNQLTKIAILLLVLLSLSASADKNSILDGPDAFDLSKKIYKGAKVEDFIKYMRPQYLNDFDNSDSLSSDMTKLHGKLSVVGGRAVLKASTDSPAGPARLQFAGFATKNKLMNPGLLGTNYVEIELAGYRNDKDYVNKWIDMYGAPSDQEDLTAGSYIMGWSIMVGNYIGQVGGGAGDPNARGVQLWFDWMSKRGVHVPIGRDPIAGDEQKYPVWDPKKVSVDEIIKKPFIAYPCLALETHFYPHGEYEMIGHKYGIGLTNDGKTLFATKDGVVTHLHDITGFFESASDTVSDGVYVSIVAASGYRNNAWKFDNIKVYSSESDISVKCSVPATSKNK